MATPLAALARLLLRASAAANESLGTAAASAFGLERVLDRCIGESSRARELLEGLDGRSLAIVVRGLGFRLRLQALKTRLAVTVESAPSGAAGAATATANASAASAANAAAASTANASPAATANAAAAAGSSSATATLEGTPPVLLGLLGNAGAEGFRESGAELSGDAATAEAFAELLRHARPDLEEELARMVGDIPAHQLAGVARRAYAWTRQAGSALAMNTSEFLQEEARQLPPRVEVNAFGRDVERLRDDVERAAQRLARLEGPRRRRPSRGGEVDAAVDRG